MSENYNVNKIRAFIGNDKIVLDKMIDIFLENTPQMISKIEEGLVEENYDQVNFYAHKLKSSIDNFSILELTNEIRLIEKYAKERISLEKLPPLVQKLKSVLGAVMDEIKTDFDKK